MPDEGNTQNPHPPSKSLGYKYMLRMFSDRQDIADCKRYGGASLLITEGLSQTRQESQK